MWVTGNWRIVFRFNSAHATDVDVFGVGCPALNNLLNCKAQISPEMAIRLDKVFYGSAEAWLALQTAYDLAESSKNGDSIAVRRCVAPEGLFRSRVCSYALSAATTTLRGIQLWDSMWGWP